MQGHTHQLLITINIGNYGIEQIILSEMFFFHRTSLTFSPLQQLYIIRSNFSMVLYIIGSLTFVFADFTQFLHYVYKDCQYLGFSINFFLSQTRQFIIQLDQLHSCRKSISLLFVSKALFQVYLSSCSAKFQNCFEIFIILINPSDKPQNTILTEFLLIFGRYWRNRIFSRIFLFLEIFNLPSISISWLIILTYEGAIFLISIFFMQKVYFYKFKRSSDPSSMKKIIEQNKTQQFIIARISNHRDFIFRNKSLTILITMDLFKGMVKKNLAWRLIHAFSKFLAGGIFLAASILLFPINQEYFNSNLIAGWLFRIGSIVWMISDIMQWQYYAQIECRCSSFVCHSALKCISTLFYFMGSGYLIPDNSIYEKESKFLGVKLFLIASILLMVSQTWKLFKIIKSNSQKILKVGMNESQRISIEYFVGFGGLFFFFGTLLFIFQELNIQNKFTIIEAFLFSLGGFFFFISGCIVHKIYFWQKGECQRIQSNEQMSQVDFVQNK